MGSLERERSERADYLDKTFPPPISREWHAPGRFTEQACEYLARPIPIELVQTGTRYVGVDAMEPNGNPIREVVSFRFRLLADPYRHEPPHWGGLDEPLKGPTEAVYYFHFSSDSSLDENVEDFRTFIAEHLEDELVPEAFPVRAGAEKSKARRDWVPLAILSVGVLGLIAVAIVAVVQQAIVLAIALASVATTVAGIGSMVRTRTRPMANGQVGTNGYSRSQLGPFLEREETLSSQRMHSRRIDTNL